MPEMRSVPWQSVGVLAAGILVGAALALAYDGPYELLPVAAALTVAAVAERAM